MIEPPAILLNPELGGFAALIKRDIHKLPILSELIFECISFTIRANEHAQSIECGVRSRQRKIRAFAVQVVPQPCIPVQSACFANSYIG